MQLKLIVLEGIRKDEEFTIKGTVTIGRTGADLSLKDPKTSTAHAKITRQGTGFLISDLNSLNGTFVNYQRIDEPCLLKKGDKIQIGKTHIEVMDISSDSHFEEGSWQAPIEQLLTQAASYYSKLPHILSRFSLFKKPLTLIFTNEGHEKAQYFFSYGPRKLNGHDFEYNYPEDFSFELQVDAQKNTVFVTNSEDVKINGQQQTQKILEDQDVISIGQIELIVKF